MEEKIHIVKLEDGKYKMIIPADVVDIMPKGEAFTIYFKVD